MLCRNSTTYIMLTAVFALVIFEILLSCFIPEPAWIMILLFVLSCVAGMTGAHHCDQSLDDMWYPHHFVGPWLKVQNSSPLLHEFLEFEQLLQPLLCIVHWKYIEIYLIFLYWFFIHQHFWLVIIVLFMFFIYFGEVLGIKLMVSYLLSRPYTRWDLS
jgi:hypothetical protein